MLNIRWTRPGPRRDTEAMPTAPAAGPGAGRPPAGRGTGTPRPGAVEREQVAADSAPETPPAAPPHSSRKRTHRESRRRRSVLVRFDEAEYAAVRIGVAVNKLAAKALAGGAVS